MKLIFNDTTHSYYLGGRRAKSVTAVAKLVADSFALDQWRKRQIAIGMMLDPRLAERVAVDPDNREAVDQICEEAMMLAGAHHAANRGTQRHRASELVDTGGTLLTEQQRADAQAWRRTMEHHRIEIDPDFVEGFVAWPDYVVTGRFDRIVRYRGRHAILDLKSGENAVKYPQSTAAQLALYARAPLISASVSTAGDKSTVTDWQEPPADLDLDTGYVVLLGDEMEIGELWRLNLVEGWKAAQLALDLVQWRKGFAYGADLAVREEPITEDEAIAIARDVLEAQPLSLVEQITAADSAAVLEALWTTNRAAWGEEHTLAAKQRKQHLHGRSLRSIGAGAA